MVVRFSSGEPRDLAEQAALVIDQEEGLQVSDVVIAETVYVMNITQGGVNFPLTRRTAGGGS